MPATPLASPPAEMNFVGTPNFDEMGRFFRDLFIRDGGLKRHERVLDVGCGVGRMALPLTDYLTPPGSYDGIDIVDVGIDWCRTNITPRYPHFQFRTANVYNTAYHPAGRYHARDYRFPYPSEAFDFVFLASVFTHMRPADMENYLAEVARVLKIGGRCFITYFLRTEEAVRYCSTGTPGFTFEHALPGCWTANPATPEDALAYAEPYVLDLYRQLGLTPAGPVRYGWWSGRPNGYTGQDVIIAVKTRSARPRFALQIKRFAGRLRARCWPGHRAGAVASGVAGAVGRARAFVRGDRAA